MIMLLLPKISMADESAWGDVGGGTFEVPAQNTTEAPNQNITTATIQPSPTETTKNIPCGQDDPRLKNIVVVLKKLKAGNKIKPLQLSFGTYITLSEKIRTLVGDNFFISAPDCNKQVLFDGELTGKVSLPFPEVMLYINDALRTRDLPKLKFIFANIKATPETLHNIMNYSHASSYSLASGKILLELIDVQPIGKNKTSIGILLLNIYQALGGRLASGEKNVIYIFCQHNGNYVTSVQQIYSEDHYFVDLGKNFYKNQNDWKDIVTTIWPINLEQAYTALGGIHFITTNQSAQDARQVAED